MMMVGAALLLPSTPHNQPDMGCLIGVLCDYSPSLRVCYRPAADPHGMKVGLPTELPS
jgi:hypothetical protein